MDLYTLDRNFHKKDIIDGFVSTIWTERYYGNGEVELVVPANKEMIQKLPEGIFLGLDESDEVMILESALITPDGNLKVTGMGLLPWMNNRFFRATPSQQDQKWVFTGGPAGWVIWAIMWNACHKDSPHLQVGATSMGVDHPEKFVIPGLYIVDYDKSGPNITWDVSYGPVYDEMAKVAVGYEIGMKLTLDSVTDTDFSLGFLAYKGLDRTSDQSTNPVVRFSAQMDSFTNITELRSIKDLKTVVYTFATGLGDGSPLNSSQSGSAALTDPTYTGFDLRALEVFVDDLTEEQVGSSAATLLDALNARALVELVSHPYAKTVDGEIVQTNQFKYGRDYYMGDIIEVQGNSEIVSKARVTEYIRSQDDSGVKTFPTVTMIE